MNEPVDNDIIDIFELDDPHPLDEPAPPTRFLRSTETFYNNNNLYEFTSIHVQYDEFEVPSNGSCGFIAYCEATFFCQDQNHPRQDVTMSSDIANYRCQLYHHLRSISPFIEESRPILDALGDSLPDFQGSSHAIMNHVGASLWERGIDFDLHCGREHWMDIALHTPLMSHKEHVTIGVYSDAPQPGYELNKSTLLRHTILKLLEC